MLRSLATLYCEMVFFAVDIVIAAVSVVFPSVHPSTWTLYKASNVRQMTFKHFLLELVYRSKLN